ncbi:hypothetical protein [Citrobacter sp. W8]|uniref:hypothetical protein n=1 Tax=Citrobacter sp. W8 TaxID=2998572 RepID=UPI00227ACFAA|nr:hypothetical protein [Citrobacter sp. W8]
MNSNIFLKGQAHSINAKQRPNVKKAQGFVVDEKEAFENVYTFQSNTDECSDEEDKNQSITDNAGLVLQPAVINDSLFDEVE